MQYLDISNQEEGVKPEEMSDEKVLALSIKEPRHFEIIVDRYQAAFTRNARKVLGNREEVDDAVQEAFTKIYMNASRYEPVEGAKFSSWAYKILFNTTFTHYKKLKRVDESGAKLDEEIWALIPDAKESDFEKLTARDLIARTIAKMPEPLAKILTLHYLEDRPQKEIAEMEGVTVSAVKTRIHRAKKEFKKINIGIV